MSEKSFKRYYTSEEAAKYLCIKESRLRNLRYQKKGPNFYNPGGNGRPLYDRDDLDAWVKGGSPDAKE